MEPLGILLVTIFVIFFVIIFIILVTIAFRKSPSYSLNVPFPELMNTKVGNAIQPGNHNFTITTTEKNDSSTVEVPQLIQKGPTCGLYALSMVMEYYHKLDISNPIYMVSSSDTVSEFGKPTSIEKILDYVIKSGYSLEGEMFDINALSETANHFRYCSTVHDNVNDIYSILDTGHPVIVAFDVADDGSPTEANGTYSHYAVIESYFKQGSKIIFKAKHSWVPPRGVEDYLWTSEEILNSMNGLEYTTFYGSPYNEPKAIHLPTYQSDTTKASLVASLRNKLLEVKPC
jgi:hypothetical protein